MTADYHQYFIKNGRHIGLYDEMYRNCPDPWNIEKMGIRLDMEAALLLLKNECADVKYFLDIGAGLGLFSSLLCRQLWLENTEAEGMITDISKTAITSAEKRLRHQNLSFSVLDACDTQQLVSCGKKKFDLIIMAQVLWGILEKLPKTLNALYDILNQGGRLLISQHFMQPGQQSYGQDIVSSPEDLVVHLQNAGFTIKKTIESNRQSNHHWAALIKKEN